MGYGADCGKVRVVSVLLERLRRTLCVLVEDCLAACEARGFKETCFTLVSVVALSRCVGLAESIQTSLVAN